MDTQKEQFENVPGSSYIVVGAYGGIGSALVRALSERSCRVFLIGKDEQKLASLSAELTWNGGQCKFAVADASNFLALKEAFDVAKESLGQIDGVANCVGSLLLKGAHQTREEEWNSVIATNLTSAFACVKFGAEAMMSSGGSIVLVSSAAAKIGLPNHDAIAAAKAGIEGLMRSAASTYARRNIRVNAVAPGLTQTPLTEKITSNPMQLQASLNLHALGRTGRPEEIASAIDWLLNAQNSWITGQVIAVDGGLSTLKALPAAVAKVH